MEPSARGGKLRVLTELRGSRVVVRITNTLPPKDGRHGAPDDGGAGSTQGAMALRWPMCVRGWHLLHDVQGEFTAGVQDGLYQVRISLARRPSPKRTPAPPPARGTPCAGRAPPLRRGAVPAPTSGAPLDRTYPPFDRP